MKGLNNPLTLKRHPYKMVKNILKQFVELFKCVGSFCGVDAQRIKQLF